MGLGKTIQSLAVLLWLNQYYNLRGPFLVVAPLTSLENWKREIELWTDFNVVVYHGAKSDRDIITKFEFTYDNEYWKTASEFRFNILLTSYEIIVKEKNMLSKIHWQYLILDEAHRIKRTKTKQNQSLYKFTFDQCVLLTGTPIQNNLSELWTVLNFLDRKKFSTYTKFIDKYGTCDNVKDITRLQKILKLYLLRRTKEVVAKSKIPPKEEIIINIELTRLQKKYYRAIYEKNLSILGAGKVLSTNLPKLRYMLMEQRKVCLHPYLFENILGDDITGLIDPSYICSIKRNSLRMYLRRYPTESRYFIC